MDNILSNPGVNIVKIQYIAIVGSILLSFFILNLIRKKKIKEEYSLIWLLLCIVFVVFSFWRQGLDYVSNLMGVAYPPAALFIILLLAIFLILIQYSRIISKLIENNKNLTQDHSILKLEVEFLKEELQSRDNIINDENSIRS